MDNNWVSLELLADNTTFVGTTDTQRKLEIDFETLDTKDLIQFQDDVGCMSGVTHSRKMANGTVISICSVLNMKTKKMDLVVYKMEGTNITKRVPIARVE